MGPEAAVMGVIKRAALHFVVMLGAILAAAWLLAMMTGCKAGPLVNARATPERPPVTAPATDQPTPGPSCQGEACEVLTESTEPHPPLVTPPPPSHAAIPIIVETMSAADQAMVIRLRCRVESLEAAVAGWRTLAAIAAGLALGAFLAFLGEVRRGRK